MDVTTIERLARGLHLLIFFAIAMMGAWQHGVTGQVDELAAIVAIAGCISLTIELCYLEINRWRLSLLYLLSAVTYAIGTWGAGSTIIQLLR